jgi:hypothetical protein
MSTMIFISRIRRPGPESQFADGRPRVTAAAERLAAPPRSSQPVSQWRHAATLALGPDLEPGPGSLKVPARPRMEPCAGPVSKFRVSINSEQGGRFFARIGRARMRRPLHLNLAMASRDLVLFLVLLPCATAFVVPGLAPFRSALRSSRIGQSTSLRHSFLPSGNSRIAARSQMPRMSGASGFDYDVVIVGCGVGGHGAALHARAQV